ncbi:E3 ubiquitin-protein ligase MARCHF3-like [Apis cerana]|uniref:E3 ubiquitin-protein ligase MARCHF3-like n=1 Tax=Apis cerana TaxID=7461 RepID=UPI002B2324B4|nr:E3 ubiquitin-protein ligase MARCHF3-like [Apis cerana]
MKDKEYAKYGTVEELINPCECSGTLGLIHTCCLEKWLSMSNTDRCEICKHLFSIQRKNKSLSQSFKQWWRTRNIYGPQGITGDIVCLIVLTPLCIAATYLCAVGASAYSRLGFWEGTGLAILCCMLVTTYCLWLIVTLSCLLRLFENYLTARIDIGIETYARIPIHIITSAKEWPLTQSIVIEKRIKVRMGVSMTTIDSYYDL